MNDDWRLRVTCPTTAKAVALSEELRGGGVEHGLNSAPGERVVVSVVGNEMFVYAATRDQAEKAGETIVTLGGRDQVPVETELRRWHPVAEQWVEPDSPLPSGEDAVAAEHAELIAREREESASLHGAAWEVRVRCASHRDVVALAERLRNDGIPSLRRWHYLLVGAADEDSARALSERIAGELPAGSTVELEASVPTVEAEMPPNPFAVFGGLGG